MFMKKKPKSSKLFPLCVAVAIMSVVAFEWSYVLDFIVRGVAS